MGLRMCKRVLLLIEMFHPRHSNLHVLWDPCRQVFRTLTININISVNIEVGYMKKNLLSLSYKIVSKHIMIF